MRQGLCRSLSWFEDIISIQDNTKLRQLLEVRSRELRELRDNSERLQSVLDSSNNQKDIIISQLNYRLQALEKKDATEELLCHSLSEESSTLRRELRTMQTKCQDLELKLAQEQRRKTLPSGAEKIVQSEEKVLPFSSEVDTLRQNLKKVTRLNVCWQEFHRKQQDRIQQLESQLKGEQTKEGLVPEFHQVSTAANRRIAECEEAKQKALNENTQLKEQNHNLQLLLLELEAELRRVEVHAPSKDIQAYKEKISVLEAQVQVFVDDFKAERKDREHAQSRLAEVEAELSHAKQQHGVGAHGMDYSQARQDALRTYEQEYRIRHGHQLQNDDFMARGPAPTTRIRMIEMTDTAEDSPINTGDDGFDEIDSSYFPQPTSRVQESKTAKECFNEGVPSSDDLECPRCRKTYSIINHDDFLDHLDTCCT